MELIDLTLRLQDGSLSYPGDSIGLSMERIPMDSAYATLTALHRFDPHCGTHFDAPLHFDPDGPDVDTTPLRLPEIVLVSSSISPIPADVLPAQTELMGRAVLISTNWEQSAGTPGFFHDFPVLSTSLAKRLVDARVALVGVDSPSVDRPHSEYPVHRRLLSAGVPILEGLVNLPSLAARLRSDTRAWLAAFPLRIRGLEGSPIRAVAIVGSPDIASLPN